MSDKAELKLPDGQVVQLPTFTGSTGEVGIDIAKLRAETKAITLDPGYGNTGSCTSSIAFIDGEKGILRYRGIPIEDLAEKGGFLETSFLLINGHLPNKDELNSFEEAITKHTLLHEDVKQFFDGFPKDAHPMAMLSSVVAALSTFYQNEVGSPEEVTYLNSIRLIAKLPTIAAYAHKKSIGQPFIYPDNSRKYSENFLYMMFGVPCEKYEVMPELVEALEALLIIHADHEQNCSTSTVRQVRSSMANMFACISAGIGALWGHRHGGANQQVIEMLQAIHEDGGNMKKYVDMAKDKNSGFRLMGFGHRVYKNFDPRAKIIKRIVDKVFAKLNVRDPLLDLAKELEAVALSDDYFVERNLYPNVDFYSGILYKAMNIPVPTFPVMFAIGRLPGWIAQAKEYTEDPNNRICRPRQIYTGPELAEYIPIEKR
ncbi:MAG: citrate synthase [Bdellovibrionota bacterium]